MTGISSAGARFSAHARNWSAGRPLAWVSTGGTGSPAGGGTPSGMKRPSCQVQLDAKSIAVAPIDGDRPQPTPRRHKHSPIPVTARPIVPWDLELPGRANHQQAEFSACHCWLAGDIRSAGNTIRVVWCADTLRNGKCLTDGLCAVWSRSLSWLRRILRPPRTTPHRCHPGPPHRWASGRAIPPR